MNYQAALRGTLRGLQFYRAMHDDNVLTSQYRLRGALHTIVTNAIDLDCKVVSPYAWSSVITQEEYERLLNEQHPRSGHA